MEGSYPCIGTDAVAVLSGATAAGGNMEPRAELCPPDGVITWQARPSRRRETPPETSRAARSARERFLPTLPGLGALPGTSAREGEPS